MHNIEKTVKHTFKSLRCLKHNIFKNMFNHFFNFIYEKDRLLEHF